jgi:hypothetical protein
VCDHVDEMQEVIAQQTWQIKKLGALVCKYEKLSREIREMMGGLSDGDTGVAMESTLEGVRDQIGEINVAGAVSGLATAEELGRLAGEVGSEQVIAPAVGRSIHQRLSALEEAVVTLGTNHGVTEQILHNQEIEILVRASREQIGISNPGWVIATPLLRHAVRRAYTGTIHDNPVWDHGLVQTHIQSAIPSMCIMVQWRCTAPGAPVPIFGTCSTYIETGREMGAACISGGTVTVMDLTQMMYLTLPGLLLPPTIFPGTQYKMLSLRILVISEGSPMDAIREGMRTNPATIPAGIATLDTIARPYAHTLQITVPDPPAAPPAG